jgi:hypothetical protein
VLLPSVRPSGPSGTAACKQILHAASNGDNSGLQDVLGVALSGDGNSLYAVSQDDDAVSRFKRSP